MKRATLLLFLPVALLGQVEVDTVVDLGHQLYSGSCYIPELNRLYVTASYRVIGLDCSTWQKTAEFPTSAYSSSAAFAWSPVRGKLYVALNPEYGDSMLVIYTDADTSRWIPVSCRCIQYVASRDRLYATLNESAGRLAILSCATDSIVKLIEPSEPGYQYMTASWDSVANRVFVSMGGWNRTTQMVVYDVGTDSLLAQFTPRCPFPLKLSFHHPSRRAYVVADGIGCPVGLVDTDRLELAGRFPFSAWGNPKVNDWRGPVAVNTDMDRVYIGGNAASGQGMLFVVDVADEDSTVRVIRGIPGVNAHQYVVWVPWSNRVYCDAAFRHMAVLDCESDSLIIRELVLPGQRRAPLDIQLDPVRERIFAIGASPTAVHVLRDLPYGVEDATPASVRMSYGGPGIVRANLRLDAGACSTGPAMLFNATGRKVMELEPGPNDIRHIAPGAHFLRQAAGVARVVIVR